MAAFLLFWEGGSGDEAEGDCVRGRNVCQGMGKKQSFP
jgi:hypothetical protein